MKLSAINYLVILIIKEEGHGRLVMDV